MNDRPRVTLYTLTSCEFVPFAVTRYEADTSHRRQAYRRADAELKVVLTQQPVELRVSLGERLDVLRETKPAMCSLP